MEVLDPQLRNNEELVKALEQLETTWSLATNQISETSKFAQLYSFAGTIETTAKKYPAFGENVECRDASIFMSLPNLFILRSLQKSEDASKLQEGITRFCPDML